MRLVMTALTSVGWLSSLGCAPTVQAGLANAPALGGSTMLDARVNDVISNGQDSCGRRMDPNQGPLRYRVPPCGHASVPGTSSALTHARAHDDTALEWMWMGHYFGWPCEPKQESLSGPNVLAWSAGWPPPGRCGLP